MNTPTTLPNPQLPIPYAKWKSIMINCVPALTAYRILPNHIEWEAKKAYSCLPTATEWAPTLQKYYADTTPADRNGRAYWRPDGDKFFTYLSDVYRNHATRWQSEQDRKARTKTAATHPIQPGKRIIGGFLASCVKSRNYGQKYDNDAWADDFIRCHTLCHSTWRTRDWQNLACNYALATEQYYRAPATSPRPADIPEQFATPAPEADQKAAFARFQDYLADALKHEISPSRLRRARPV